MLGTRADICLLRLAIMRGQGRLPLVHFRIASWRVQTTYRRPRAKHNRVGRGVASRNNFFHRSDDVLHRRAPLVTIFGKLGPSDALRGTILPHTSHLLWGLFPNAGAYSPPLR